MEMPQETILINREEVLCMNKFYKEPKLEVVFFDRNDIITTSGGVDTNTTKDDNLM